MSESASVEESRENLRKTLSQQQVKDICVLIEDARHHPLRDWEFDHIRQESLEVPDIDGALLLLARKFLAMLDDGSEFDPVVEQPGEEGEDSVA